MFYIKILIVVIILLITIINLIVRKVLYPKHYSLKTSKQLLQQKEEWNNFDQKDTEELNFLLNDNYTIHGTMVYSNRKSNKFVIHTHGFGFTRYGGIKYLNAFSKAGYNVYLYDLRFHGENKKGPIGMGEIESKDLLQIINKIRLKYGSKIQLGLHGESLGAFTSLIVLKYKPKIDFVIEDCAYSNTISELKFQMKRNHFPLFLFGSVVLISKLIYKQHWVDYDARNVVENEILPICFIHGKDDTFTPPYMAKELYNACKIKSNKQLVYFENAKHANSEESNPDKYTKIINNFLNSV